VKNKLEDQRMRKKIHSAEKSYKLEKDFRKFLEFHMLSCAYQTSVSFSTFT